MSADLHIHTTASDGRLEPEEIVQQAIKVGLKYIAITDHDTIDGIRMLLTCEPYWSNALTVIPGIEFSTDLPDNEVHILGYFIDISNQHLLAQLSILKTSRRERYAKTVEKLAALGYHLDQEYLLSFVGQAKSVGRPHLAKALVGKGYFASTAEVFATLLNKNGPAYVPHYKLSPREVIKVIKDAGGVSVLAHPGLVGSDEIVAEIVNEGICGLEVYHPTHSDTQTAKYLALAIKHNLLITGGSDFHAIPERYPASLGQFAIPSYLAEKLKRYVQA